MAKFVLSVQLDFVIEIDPDSGQELSADNVRKLAFRRLWGGRPERWQVPGVKSRWFTRSFAPSSKGVAEVVEITPEMETVGESYPQWRLERVK